VRIKELAGKMYLYGPPELQSRFSLSFAELPRLKFDIQIRAGDKNVRPTRCPS
jgi:hypothetical protein